MVNMFPIQCIFKKDEQEVTILFEWIVTLMGVNSFRKSKHVLNEIWGPLVLINELGHFEDLWGMIANKIVIEQRGDFIKVEPSDKPHNFLQFLKVSAKIS